MKTAEDILSEYRARVTQWKLAKNSTHKDMQPLTAPDVLFLRSVLHPTNRQEAKELTRKLVVYVCEAGVTTATEACNDLQITEKSFLKRMKVLMNFGIIRRESKKYYLATPRMQELVSKRYIEKLCE